MKCWDRGFERECHALVVELCDVGKPARVRDAAWRKLLERVAPHVEGWAAASPVLRRCGLDSEDDARGVLVEVITRLGRRDFDNLRRYLAAQPSPDAGDDADELDVVESLARLAAGGADGEPEARDAASGDLVVGTPLRGWLLGLTRFAVKDHVKQRLGWASSARATFLLEAASGAGDLGALVDGLRDEAGVLAVDYDAGARTLAIEHLAGTVSRDALARLVTSRGWRVVDAERSASKRDLGTDAERLDDVREQGERPPITDLMALRSLLDKMRAYMATFPAAMQQALALWMSDADYDEIAAKVGLEDADKARALVRAGQARLRQKFRQTGDEAT